MPDCDSCDYARTEIDPYATGDRWYVEYYCTRKRCIELDPIESDTETSDTPDTKSKPETENVA